MGKGKKRRLSESLNRPAKRKAIRTGNRIAPSVSQPAMAIGRPSLTVTGAVNIEWKLLRRFYEPMILLSVLDPLRSEHIGRPSDPNHWILSPTELRRAFVDKLAYLCDFKKGGDTITAIALQSLPEGIIIHCATNNPMKPQVLDFINRVLALVATVNNENCPDIEATILREALVLSRERLTQYWKLAEKSVIKCSKHLLQEKTGLNGDSELCAWLSKLQRISSDSLSLVKECYEARDSCLQAIALRSLEGRPHNRAFKDLHHFIGRLGAHPKAAKTLLAASLRMPGLLDGFSVKVEPSSTHAVCKLVAEDTTAYNIMGRMCPQDGSSKYREALKFLDSSYGLNLDVGLKENCRFETRVHAELLLLELFLRNKYEFVESDRYIGCSKPACYSCYQYFLAQTTTFVLPACHNKLYLRWRPPDIFNEQDAEAIKRRSATMNEMNARIRIEIKEQLERRTLSNGHHFDSTSGTSLAISIEASSKLRKSSGYDLGLSENADEVSVRNPSRQPSSPHLEAFSEESEAGLDEMCETDSDGGVSLL